MGMLFVSDEAKARIEELITLAHARPIGENEPTRESVLEALSFMESQHVELGTYYARYILARAIDGRLYRHVSVGSLQHGRVPHPVIVEEICMLFGFRHHSVDGWLRRPCDCGCGAVSMMQAYVAAN